MIATRHRYLLKNISQSAVIPAHFHLSYGDNSGGIHLATPAGVLHVLCENGLFKKLLRVSVELEESLEDLFHLISLSSASYIFCYWLL